MTGDLLRKVEKQRFYKCLMIRNRGVIKNNSGLSHRNRRKWNKRFVCGGTSKITNHKTKGIVALS